jgi:methionine-S-sulfoxide reductase
MEIKLYKNGRDFAKSHDEVLKKSPHYKDMLFTLNNINGFNNKNFVISYDNLHIISYRSKMYLLGYQDELDNIIDDLYLRNVEFKHIYTSNVKFINLLKKKYNFKIEFESKSYFVSETNIRRTVFSGGCFWCMAHPYYKEDGVLKVISGYAGGTTLNPTYLETKHGENDFRESVLIVYDTNKTSYANLLKLYFESIDPFDSLGQFIDKGKSYTTCVYFKNKDEETVFNNYKAYIESSYKLEVKVLTDNDTIFYKAEDEHQEFEFKNKDKFLAEEESSGRNKFNYVKIS